MSQQGGLSGVGVGPYGETITGDIGGPQPPSAGNWDIITAVDANNSGSTILFSGADSTLTLDLSDSNFNTFLGSSCGNVNITTGSTNTGVGAESFGSMTSGTHNTGIGVSVLEHITTGTSNTALGYNTGASLVTGGNNILVGTNSGSAYTSSEDSNIIIGASGAVAESNTIRIGTQGSGSAEQNGCFIAGIVGVTVDNAEVVVIDSMTGQLGVSNDVGGYISLSPYIVGTDTHSGFSTIQDAINQAILDGAGISDVQNIYVKPKMDGSAYSEDLILSPGINLIAFPGLQQQGLNRTIGGTLSANDVSVTVTGSHSLTGGNVRINGFHFNSFGVPFAFDSSQNVYLENCYSIVTSNPIFSLSNGVDLYLKNCVLSTAGNTVLSYANDSGTYNIIMYETDFYETGSGVALGTGSTVSYDIQNCNMTFSPIDSTNATAFSYSALNSSMVNLNAATPFTIGSSTSQLGFIAGIYLKGCSWELQGLDSSTPMFINNNSIFTITLDTCFLTCSSGVTLANSPFPAAGQTRYSNCKIYYSARAALYTIDHLLSDSGLPFNQSPTFHIQQGLQTTNDTGSKLFGVPIQASGGNNTASFWGTVTGSKSDYSDVLIAQFTVVGSRVGAANITILTPYINQQTTSTAGIGLVADVSSQSIDLMVLGLAGSTYNWILDGYFQYLPNSS